jgi:hypothetical protein
MEYRKSGDTYINPKGRRVIIDNEYEYIKR